MYVGTMFGVRFKETCCEEKNYFLDTQGNLIMDWVFDNIKDFSRVLLNVEVAL